MSESEQKQSKPDVEDGHSAKQDPLEEEKKEEKEVKDELNALRPLENNVRDAPNVPEVVVQSAGDDLDADADGDSEAETLIQSPEKKRNSVADGSTVVHQVKIAGSDPGSIVIANTSDKENITRKRKRSQEEGSRDSPARLSSRHSSPLSSPVPHMQSDDESNDSDVSDTKASSRQHNDSDDQDNLKLAKKRRRPSEGANTTTSSKRSKRNSLDLVERRETRSATYPRPSDDEKSPSPERVARREHRRGASTQLTTGEFERKKRGRPPLINTRRNRSADRVSNSSEESGPRTGRARPNLHKLASNDHDIMSPAKVGPRKWKDKNGRTYLARACANNDLEAARARLAERVEDLNMEDNAGNTPLQIASLEGFEEIVEFLLSKGAEVNVRNVDKDTPLIDAVENGHIEVIKLLLKYGANPRMGNAKGDEPYELVHPEDDSYGEIRELLAGAKDKDAKKTPGVDALDMQTRDGASSRAASAASPRDSPPVGPRSPPAFGSRRRTGRSESTRNDLLWQANTQENLAKLAGKGDVQGVASILSILEKAETEALIAAAKAGHEEVLQLLIAMGKPNPDPDPVRSSKLVPGYNTPMLAAIGRGHPDVVKLLSNQSGFNPMKRYKEKTYYELAEDRHGDRWEEEFKILKQAYERAKGKKSNSPKKTREMERARPRRRSSSVNSTRRQLPSPTSTHKSLPTISSPRERRKISDPASDRTRNEDTAESSLAVASDVDQTVRTQAKTHRTRRSQSDLPPLPLLDNEPMQRRRRLVTGKEHRSRNVIGISSDREEDDETKVKQEDRSNLALKRSRVSSTPDPPEDGKERKKRRTVLESSPDDIRPRATARSIPTPPIPSIEEENTKLANGSQDSLNAAAGEADVKSDIEETKAVLVQEPKELTLPEVPSPAPDVEVLPDAVNEDSDDHYSPPPAVEPPMELEANQEDENEDHDVADRLAQEQALLKEEQQKAEDERQTREAAAEDARLTREAEEKRKRDEEIALRKQEEERQEQIKQETEAKRRLEEMERERERLEKLPILLARTAQMIDENDSDVRSLSWLSKFLPLYAVRTRQLDPSCDMSMSEEEWVPNFQVAGLLSTKDLTLQSYGSFERRSVSAHERQCLWRVARLNLSYDTDPDALWTTSVSKATEMEIVAQEKFMSMEELFWIKVS